MDHLQLNASIGRKFKSQNNRVYSLGNDLLGMALILNKAFLKYEFESFVESLMLQDLLALSREGLVMATLQKPTISFALLRLATEKYRDLRCVIEHPELAELYKKGRKSAPKGLWRKSFRFSTTDRAVHQLYNVTSDFGVHSTFALPDSLASIKTIDGENYMQSTHFNSSKDAFKLNTMGLNLFLMELRQVLATRINDDKNMDSAKFKITNELLKTLSILLLEIGPKIEKLVKNYKGLNNPDSNQI